MPSSMAVAHVGKMTIKCVWNPQALAPAPLRQVSSYIYTSIIMLIKYVVPKLIVAFLKVIENIAVINKVILY